MLFAVMCSMSLDYRNWFVHDNPWPIRLTGRQVRVAFADGGPIEIEVVDAWLVPSGNTNLGLGFLYPIEHPVGKK